MPNMSGIKVTSSLICNSTMNRFQISGWITKDTRNISVMAKNIDFYVY